MALLLHIDTAGTRALVGFSQNQVVLATKFNEQTNKHAEFVQVAIQELTETLQLTLDEIDAIVVTLGPGSYTGLRVGLASAKGLAFALDKPLIGLSTLELLAKAALHQIKENEKKEQEKQYRIFAMIDARRMEIFGAIYDTQLQPLEEEKSTILDEAYLQQLVQNGPVVCIGSAVTKTKLITSHPNLTFLDIEYNALEMMQLGEIKFANNQFENLAYCTPSYLKEYYTTSPKSNDNQD